MDNLNHFPEKCPFNLECPLGHAIEAYKEAFENSTIGTAISTVEGNFIHANNTYCNMLGYTNEELQKMTFSQVTYPEDLERNLNKAQECIDGKSDFFIIEKRYVHKNGTPIWVEIHTGISKDRKYFISHVISIDKNKNIEHNFADTQKILQLAIEGSNDGFWDWNLKTGDIFLSSKSISILEFKENESDYPKTFSNVISFVHPEDRGKVLSKIKENLDTCEPIDLECRIIAKDNKTKWCRIKGQAVWDKDEPLRMAGFISDITNEKERQKQLKVALETVKKKNEELEQFAYIASHDLQEPIRTVSSYLQLFSIKYKDKLDDKANQYIKFILDADNRMRELIRNLLEYSRSGNLGVCQDISFHAIMDEVKATMNTKIESSKAKITYDKNDTNIYANTTDVLRLFQNLVSNSIKFKKINIKPCIKITYRISYDYTSFRIKDNGIGIDKEYLSKMFNMFFRVTNNTQGNGIGLPVCKRIVDKYNGRIWVESELGKGSSFYFTLPNKKKELSI